MTYCLGWTAHGCAFLAADAAVTRRGGRSREHTSSFGERHVRNPGRLVDQEVLKISTLKSGGITFAGSSQRGQEIVRLTRAGIQSGSDPDRAFQDAFSSLHPSGSDGGIQAVLAWHNGAAPRLMWSPDNGQSFEEGDFVQFGSIGESFKDLTQGMVSEVRERDVGAPALMAGAMSLMQSYGIVHGLFESGVGGQINGGWVDANGGHWQPDMLYVLYDSQDLSRRMSCISSIVRDSVAVVGSSVTRDTRCFATELGEKELALWKSRWIPEVLNQCAKGRADYVCFLDRRFWRAVLVEQGSQLESAFLKLTPSPAGTRAALMDLSPRLASALTRDMAGKQMSLEFIA